jgi:hypothetical protein
LYNSDLVIVEKVIGEPAPKRKHTSEGAVFLISIVTAVLVSLMVLWISGGLVSSKAERFSNVKQAGCDLRIISFYDRYGERLNSPWRIKDRIYNAGTQSCVVESVQVNPKGPFPIGPGDVFEKEWIVERVPTLVGIDLSVGLTNTTLEKTHIQLFGEQ